jgi:SAM-dependent methyltransferase
LPFHCLPCPEKQGTPTPAINARCTWAPPAIDLTFLDLFSQHSSSYAAARPGYPDALYQAIVSLVPRRSRAWDCATGNGQAARDLARYFSQVIATDASVEQIASATPVANVEYRVATAEASGLPDKLVELVTIAQALHWLDHERFYPEVRRVVAEGGIIAAWCYGSFSAGADIESLLREFEFGTLGPYWDGRRRWVDAGYRTIPFPFDEIAMPSFELRVNWTLGQVGQYLRSWSAVVKYVRERGEDPVIPLLEQLQHHWGKSERSRQVTWPLGTRVGRVG